nr:HAD-IA family hydrolase [Bacillota bacterium]
DPEVFLKAAEMLKIPPENCLVVEDADAGIEAGKKGGMKTLSVHGAKGADFAAEELTDFSILADIVVLV